MVQMLAENPFTHRVSNDTISFTADFFRYFCKRKDEGAPLCRITWISPMYSIVLDILRYRDMAYR